ncbi:hypothetical protein L1887_60326 [Cichorium endivia]|nr:hypothetical protein L1887_60326 [Cichorium endivia]
MATLRDVPRPAQLKMRHLWTTNAAPDAAPRSPIRRHLVPPPICLRSSNPSRMQWLSQIAYASLSKTSPAYGGLFDGDASPFAPSQRDQAYLARSYLALRDDEDDGAALRGRHLSPKIAATESPRLEQPQKPIVHPACGSSLPTNAARGQKLCAIQHSRRRGRHAKDRARHLQPQRHPAALHSPPNALTAQAGRARAADAPSIPRESSLQTLRSPSQQARGTAGSARRGRAASRRHSSCNHVPSGVDLRGRYSPSRPTRDLRPPTAVNGDRAMLAANDELSDGSRWRRGQDALAAFSPAQQSRFSRGEHGSLRLSRTHSKREPLLRQSFQHLQRRWPRGRFERRPLAAHQRMARGRERTPPLSRQRCGRSPPIAAISSAPSCCLSLHSKPETATVDAWGPVRTPREKARRALFFDLDPLTAPRTAACADVGGSRRHLGEHRLHHRVSQLLGAHPQLRSRGRGTLLVRLWPHPLVRYRRAQQEGCVSEHTHLFRPAARSGLLPHQRRGEQAAACSCPVNRFALERVAPRV